MMHRRLAPPPYAAPSVQLRRAVSNRRALPLRRRMPVPAPLFAHQPLWRRWPAPLSRLAAPRRPPALPLPVACPPRARMQAARRLALVRRPYLRHRAAAWWAGPIGFSVCSRMLP
ncbi:hypothetical protein AQ611_00210 [Burkholderia singularis]|nr:hypothetical protein AQ611_00210 [Burkholderia sp. Bp7605]